MAISAKYAHTNIVARDWKRLAAFYEQVFGCQSVPPERHLQGAWIDDATGIPHVRIDGLHLRLPGHGDSGPTLEIFQYNTLEEKMPTRINRPGFAHIAFVVEDVAVAREAVLTAGGSDYGKIVRTEIGGAGTIMLVYMADPEGNIIELQHWETAKTQNDCSDNRSLTA